MNSSSPNGGRGTVGIKGRTVPLLRSSGRGWPRLIVSKCGLSGIWATSAVTNPSRRASSPPTTPATATTASRRRASPQWLMTSARSSS